MNYSYFTKRQANVVYAAIKRGQLHASKSEINKMYNFVGDIEEVPEIHKFNRIVEYIINNNLDAAQALLDGKYVFDHEVVIGKESIEVTEENKNEHWFSEVGDILEYPIYERVIKIFDAEDEYYKFRDSMYCK